MKVGIIGYPSAGKSALYRAAASGTAKGEVTAVVVPDPRFDRIVAQVKPKKATPATILLHDDIESIQPTGKAFSVRCLESARRADLLLHVVRAFESPMVPYHAAVNAIRDQEGVEVEIVLTDLQILESRLERLQKSMNSKNPGHPEYNEKMLFERLREPLESGTPLKNLELDEAEHTILRNYQFLSTKPVVVAFNVSEGEAAQPPPEITTQIEKLNAAGTPAFAVSATLEEELAALDPADQPEFLASLGLTEPASAKMIRAVYHAMGLITFFTAGESETKAWPLRKGSTALKAAATIHTDIARGFIRAEVIHYADYDSYGSMDAAKDAGKMTLEGKEHLIEDGDLVVIRNKS